MNSPIDVYTILLSIYYYTSTHTHTQVFIHFTIVHQYLQFTTQHPIMQFTVCNNMPMATSSQQHTSQFCNKMPTSLQPDTSGCKFGACSCRLATGHLQVRNRVPVAASSQQDASGCEFVTEHQWLQVHNRLSAGTNS